MYSAHTGPDLCSFVEWGEIVLQSAHRDPPNQWLPPTQENQLHNQWGQVPTSCVHLQHNKEQLIRTKPGRLQESLPRHQVPCRTGEQVSKKLLLGYLLKREYLICLLSTCRCTPAKDFLLSHSQDWQWAVTWLRKKVRSELEELAMLLPAWNQSLVLKSQIKAYMFSNKYGVYTHSRSVILV